MRRFRSRKGYSLIELTIVVGLVSMLAITISAIVLSAIVNSNRIKNKIRVRQAGDYAIGQIQTIIRNARSITVCDSNINSITLLNPDNNKTQIYLENGKIASNSGTYLTPDDTEISYFVLNCTPTTDPKLVNINFTLGKPASSGERAIEKPSESFSTSIEIRNY